jgi:hypothetical protein
MLAAVATGTLAAEPSKSEGNQKVGENQGLTLEDIGRGLKSAAKNIEQEIPKIGSAIGNTVKKITEKEPSKPADEKPAKQTK